MIKNHPKIYLASKSPRRKNLLQQINLEFEVFTVPLDEQFKEDENPVETVKRLSVEKLEGAKKIKNEGIILTADTIVVLNNVRIGKPKDENDAFRILKELSDNSHYVYTGFALYNSDSNNTIIDYEKTDVRFRKLSDEEITDYIKTGSPMDKAGAYGIQDDFGAVFVKEIKGCYYNVVGLPISKVYDRLKEIISD